MNYLSNKNTQSIEIQEDWTDMAILSILCDECKNLLKYRTVITQSHDLLLHVELCETCKAKIEERQNKNTTEKDTDDTAVD